MFNINRDPKKAGVLKGEDLAPDLFEKKSLTEEEQGQQQLDLFADAVIGDSPFAGNS